MPAWVITFITKYGLKVIGIIADLLVIAFIIYSCWLVFHPKPTTTQNQNAQTIVNNDFYPSKKDFAIGFDLFGVDIGIVKYSYPAKPLLKVKK